MSEYLKTLLSWFEVPGVYRVSTSVCLLWNPVLPHGGRLGNGLVTGWGVGWVTMKFGDPQDWVRGKDKARAVCGGLSSVFHSLFLTCGRNSSRGGRLPTSDPSAGTPHLCDSKCHYLRAQKKPPTAFKTLTLILRYNSHPVMSAPLYPKALQSNLIRNGRVSRAPFYFPVFFPPSLCKSSMVTSSPGMMSQTKRRGGSLMESQLDAT